MGTEKTEEIKPTGKTSDPADSKPLAVQMMDFVADSAAAFATAIVTAGVAKADEAVNKTREVVAAVDERAKAATERLQGKTAVPKPAAKKTAAKKSAPVKKKLTKKAPPKKPVKKKAPAKRPGRKAATKSKR
jgi:hypothetical protein